MRPFDSKTNSIFIPGSNMLMINHVEHGSIGSVLLFTFTIIRNNRRCFRVFCGNPNNFSFSFGALHHHPTAFFFQTLRNIERTNSRKAKMGSTQSSSLANGIDPSIPRSNPKKNHDHQKVRHETYSDAVRAKESMQRRNKSGAERLQTYYNEDTNGYYNGRSKSRSSTSSDQTIENNERDGDGDGLVLIGLVLYGAYCAGSWLVKQATKTEEVASENEKDKTSS